MTKTQKFLSLRAGVAPVVLGLALISAPAFAQDDLTDQENAASAVPEGGDVQDDGLIVVTGSRIARPDLVSASPLAVVQDEEFKLSGAVNVEQVINTLPQVIPGTTSFSNNPGGGVATLNLRGLGSQRTLVLVNSRRYMFFDTQQIVDLNTIPQFLIDAVDVVTGGASAVYGSDAIAGVVNFRLRDDLNGFEAGTQYSLTEEGDGARFNAHLAMGSEFADGRGHVTAFAEYYKRKSIFSDARGFSRVTVTDDDGGFVPGGSGTTPAGRFAIPTEAVIAPVLAFGAEPGDGSAPVFAGFGGDLNNDGDISDAEAATALARSRGTNFAGLGATFDSPMSASRPFGDADFYNYAPDNYLQVPQERWLLGGYGEYEVSDALTAFTEVTFVNNRVNAELAPTPVTGTIPVNIQDNFDAGNLTAADLAALQAIDANEEAIDAAAMARCEANNAANAADPEFEPANCANAGSLPGVGIVNIGVNRRVEETGNRVNLDERNAFRVLAGARGGITENINWDAYYSYARTRNANVQNGNVSRSAFNAGVLDGSINVFGPGALSAEDVAAISILAQNNDISTLQVASAAISGTPFNLGLGGDDVGFALGVEWRSVASRFIPDTALSSGDVVGFNAGNPTQGSYDVKEIFGELRIPIIEDAPFFDKLEIIGAGRYSDYSLDAVGGVWTYAGGVTWAPIPDITFRGNYQRAVRAPNVGELFGGQQQGFPPATDPCSLASAADDPTIRALCIATGVPAAAVGTGDLLQPNEQIQGSFGGNPNLQEETSDSYSFGAVISPRFIPRLNITVDYFNIKIDQAIAVAAGGVNNILDFCYNIVQDATAPICQLINRDPDTGIIGDEFVVEANNANLSSLETSGIDLQVDYSLPLAFGLMSEESRLNFFFLGTYTDKNNFTPVVGVPDVVECAGRFGLACGEPQAKYKWTSRLSWIDGPVTSSLRWRHMSSVRDDDDTTDYTTEVLDAYDLFDLAFAVDISDEFSMSFGVNNILDKKPQLIGDNQEQANTYPDTYDVLGRDYFVGATVRF